MTRVIIVDDKEENLYYLKALLTGHGWDVESAHHGAEALVMARRSPPDLVISDLLMPVMDGYTLLRHWKLDSLLKPVPFIVYTATYTEAEDERLAISLGADSFILKPSEPDEFLARLDEVMSEAEETSKGETREPIENEAELLRDYSDTLIRKLEEKTLQLESTNKALQEDNRKRREAAEALAKSEREQRVLAQELEIERSSLVEAQRVAKIGSWETDIVSLATDWSMETYRIFEKDPAEFSPDHESFIQLVHPEDRAEVEAAFMSSTDQNGINEIRHRVALPDGRIKYVVERWQFFYDKSGTPLRAIGTCRDITEKVNADRKLQRTTTLLEAVVEGTNDSVFVKDRKGRYLLFNSAAAEFVGLSVAEVLGKDDTEIFGEEDAMFLIERDRKVMETGETITAEEVLSAAGGTRTFSATKAPFRDSGGNIVGTIGVSRDITASKLTEKALQDSLIHNRQLGSALDEHAIVSRTDASGKITYVNEKFCAVSGYAREELVDRDHRVINSGYHSKDFFRELWARISRGKVWQGELRNRAKDGSFYWVDTTIVPFCDDEGKPYQYISIRTDVTERKQTEVSLRESESRFRKTASQLADILDNSLDVICSFDEAGRFVQVNAACESVWGYSVEELLGTKYSEKVLPEDRARTGETAAAIMAGESTRSFENRYQHRSGSIVHVQWTARWSETERTMFCVARDITEKKNLELQFLRAQRMESIGTLAGGIAHDLNNVLAPIMMSIELLKTDENDPEQADLISMIEISAKRGADMVKQVLSFARGAEGRQLEVNVPNLLKEIQNIADETFLKAIQVNSFVESDIWTLKGDPTQLHQVMLNLCVNARDAMPEGGTLTLSAENLMLDKQYSGMNLEAHPGPHVLVKVEDTGSGMPPEVIDRIFEPFYTSKEVGKGTGLGLSTTLAIIKSHDGFLRVDSEVGKGTTFQIYLPAKTDTTEVLHDSEGSDLPYGNGELILVVDDEAAIREITRQTLESSGYRVLLACDGAEAIATYANRKDEIAAVVTDMMMPIMDGATAIFAITKINPDAIIIAASGLNTSKMEEKAMNAGVKHFIPKPYTAETLLRTISTALNTPDSD